MTRRRLLTCGAGPLACTVALAGCGGHHAAQGTAQSRVALPHALAGRLASESDEVARQLAAGNDCAARAAAVRLREHTRSAIDTGLVPAAFRRTLRTATTDLPSRINCVSVSVTSPRARPAPAAQKKPGHGNHGKHKGHDKHKGDQGGGGD